MPERAPGRANPPKARGLMRSRAPRRGNHTAGTFFMAPITDENEDTSLEDDFRSIRRPHTHWLLRQSGRSSGGQELKGRAQGDTNWRLDTGKPRKVHVDGAGAGREGLKADWRPLWWSRLGTEAGLGCAWPRRLLGPPTPDDLDRLPQPALDLAPVAHLAVPVVDPVLRRLLREMAMPFGDLGVAR